MKNKILIAVDLSENTADIIEKGIQLAVKLESEVVIVSVIPIYVDYLQSQMAMVPIQWDEMYNAQKEAAFKQLASIKSNYPRVTIKIVIEIGNPKFDVIEKSLEEKATYIVVGTHGRTGLYHTVMGSTAEYIVRHATMPVLVVPMDKMVH
jgi:nucleotide-binding universal stress UspA family protein